MASARFGHESRKYFPSKTRKILSALDPTSPVAWRHGSGFRILMREEQSSMSGFSPYRSCTPLQFSRSKTSQKYSKGLRILDMKRADASFPATQNTEQMLGVYLVAGPGFEPGSGGYEPPEVPLLHPAILINFKDSNPFSPQFQVRKPESYFK